MRITYFVSAYALLLALGSNADERTFTDHQICRAAIATIMHKDVSKVSAFSADPIAVMYHSDGLQKYKCRIDGDRVMWGNADGRWRDGPYDEKVMWEAQEDTLTIRQPFRDGSESVDEFGRDQLT